MHIAEPFPFEKRNWYPHMMPADVLIWERFISLHHAAYDWVEYDVKVGSVPDFVKDDPDPSIKKQAPLYERKIDVVGHLGREIDIIELKPRAGMSTLGQVKGYVALYKRDIEPSAKLNALIITDELMPDMAELAKVERVGIIVV